jgi:hypothetical protein
MALFDDEGSGGCYYNTQPNFGDKSHLVPLRVLSARRGSGRLDCQIKKRVRVEIIEAQNERLPQRIAAAVRGKPWLLDIDEDYTSPSYAPTHHLVVTAHKGGHGKLRDQLGAVLDFVQQALSSPRGGLQPPARIAQSPVLIHQGGLCARSPGVDSYQARRYGGGGRAGRLAPPRSCPGDGDRCRHRPGCGPRVPSGRW